MKTHLGSALLALSLFCAHCVLGADGQWRVESLKLKSNEDTRRGDFTAIVVSASGGERVELSSRIPLEKIDDSFITGDKLVLLGQAYKPQAVVIFDIKLRRPIDWFACYSPERVSERWIAYVEFYFPNISGGEPTDVVLVYDLNKSPLENRLESEPEINLPPDRWTNVPTHVGVPVYPEWNTGRMSTSLEMPATLEACSAKAGMR